MVMRININLQQDSVEKKKRAFLRKSFKKVILGEVFFLAALLAINLLFGIQTIILKTELSLIDKEWKTTEPLLKERDYLLQWKNGYAGIFESIKDIFKRDISWFTILKSLSNVVPEEMWFKEMGLKEFQGKPVLEIKASVGYLDSDEDKLNKINSFIEAAKKDKVLSENFDVPDLQDVTKTKENDVDILDLKFSLTLKK